MGGMTEQPSTTSRNVVPFPPAPDAVELRHLRAFVAVAEELSFSRAAERLFLSQPALSRAIRGLEQLVGCDLLRRSTHRVELTLAGEAMLDRARPLLSDVDAAVASARSVGGELLGRAIRLWEPVIGSGGSDLDAMRDSYEALHAKFAPPPQTRVRAVTAGGVPSLVVAPDGVESVSAVLLHGGAYTLGSAFGYRALAGAIAVAAETAVLVPDFRLAPEHPFPAAVDDGLRSYLWMLDGGTPADQIVLCGDSAGAGLVMSVLHEVRRQGLPIPAGAVLLCPGLDPAAMLAGNYGTRGDIVQRCVGYYLAGHPVDDPVINPFVADLSGLPPLLIQAATGDPAIVDAQRLADRAREHGVDVRLELYPVDTHIFQLFWPFLPEAGEAIAEVGQFARHIRSPGPR